MGRPPLIALLGGTGKTGRAVHAALSRRGVEARALGRSAAADLPAALAGANAAYLIAPNLHPDEPGYVTEALAAMRAVDVERVVYHSVASPYVPAMPHHLGKAVAEDLVRRSGLSWTILQPCAYLQNLLPALRSGVLTVPYSLETCFGLVDLGDVAEAAAVVLTERGHDGATYELGGPALVSLSEVAETATEVLGTPIVATRTDPGDWSGEGLDERERLWLRAMFAYYDAYGLPTGGRVLEALLGRTPAAVADVLTRWQ